MTEDTELNIAKEIAEADTRLAVNNTRLEMPLDITIRSIALTVAQRHCGDVTVKEGNLYQQLKMDNKLSGPLTVNHVIHAALIFEMYLWGHYSRDIAGKAMEQVITEVNEAIRTGRLDEYIEGLEDQPPTRPHSGEGE